MYYLEHRYGRRSLEIGYLVSYAVSDNLTFGQFLPTQRIPTHWIVPGTAVVRAGVGGVAAQTGLETNYGAARFEVNYGIVGTEFHRYFDNTHVNFWTIS